MHIGTCTRQEKTETPRAKEGPSSDRQHQLWNRSRERGMTDRLPLPHIHPSPVSQVGWKSGGGEGRGRKKRTFKEGEKRKV